MQVYAIDPGPQQSAFIVWNGERIFSKGIVPNETLLSDLRAARELAVEEQCPVAVEAIACYGMPVGEETFQTCYVIGRIEELCHGRRDFHRCYRKDIKLHLCNSMRAKDPNVRQALIDKHGAPGCESQPGKLYGVSSHLWSALAVADYFLSAGK